MVGGNAVPTGDKLTVEYSVVLSIFWAGTPLDERGNRQLVAARRADHGRSLWR